MSFPDITPEVVQLGASLAKVSATNGATLVAQKITALKTAKREAETISGLEQLVQELLDEKAELVRVAQGYRQELTSQSLTAGDVQYITSEILPLIEQLADENGDESKREMLEKLRAILSFQTVSILQLLGFNFRKALGEPLTKLCASKITQPTDKSEDLKAKELRLIELQMQMASDPEAFERFKVIRGISWD